MVDERTIRSFRDLFLWLKAEHQPFLDDPRNSEFSKLYGELAGRFTPIEEHELEGCLPSLEKRYCDTLNISRGGRFLYLAPEPDAATTKRRNFVPFLSIRCDFNDALPKVRLGMALGSLQGDRLRLFGMRFEAPEGNESGCHDFYHAQMINEFRRGGGFPPISLNGATTWIPETQPSIPLDAVCPVTLVLSVLTSIYGVQYLDVIHRSGKVHADFFNKIPHWRDLPHYSRLKGRDGKEYVVCYNRGIDQRELKLKAAGITNDGSCMIEPCSSSEYNAALKTNSARKL
jgi:hypothetical protein